MPVRLATLLLACFPLLAMAQEDLVEQLLGQMTLEEKVGQLTQLRVKGMPTGPLIDLDNELPLPIKTVGSILDTYGAEQTLQLQRAAVESSRLHIPLLFAFDVLHGFRTAFPVPLAEAAAWDPDLTQRTARAAAVEATAAGVHWTFAPMLDITRDPRWGRVVEGAGEAPFLASALAVARVRGTHGDGPPDTSFMLATAKHFVAYGAAEGGRDYNSADLSQRSLKEVYLPPFQAAVEAGVDAVMPGFEELAGTPMHSNAALLRGLLRGRWGFSGIIVSDWMGVAELVAHGVAASPADAARQALHAGIDIDMASQSFNRYLPDLVRNGQVQLASVDNAVRNVLRAKQRLGLFEHPYRYSDPDRERAQTLDPHPGAARAGTRGGAEVHRAAEKYRCIAALAQRLASRAGGRQPGRRRPGHLGLLGPGRTRRRLGDGIARHTARGVFPHPSALPTGRVTHQPGHPRHRSGARGRPAGRCRGGRAR